ncbi:neuroligin-1-like isoform X2 [Varroa destructor]|uniref:Carboxylesterase type B domain-containing protein n=1 Tax=Varroa destructor TaxID=109461 RepID=A0A7M7JZ69_VARDE|nr:neuroligin-1-like isoform X2 [Varroa destructor]
MARQKCLPFWGENGAVLALYVFLLAGLVNKSRALLERDFADWKQSERVIRTLFGKIRGRVVLPQGRFHDIALQPVEVFLGIPYASPPVGSLRFLPPMTPAHWEGVREADHWGPSCPQPPPETPPHWSRQRPYFSKDEDRERVPTNRSWSPWPQMADFLQDNQNEDCLYLNIFAPASVGRTEHGKLPVLALAAGSSLEWGGAALLDATALAAATHALIVTFNFRLGVLGFFPAMDEASRANNALLDQVAALHWIQRNIDLFGGDHTRVTLLGHGKVSSLAHFLAMYPFAKDLFRSVALMSGSALSPWSLCQSVNMQRFATQLAQSLSCPTRPRAMVECLRHKSADELVEMSRFPDEVPDYLCGPFGPVVDNSVISAGGIRTAMSQSPFSDHDLLLGVTTRDALPLFSVEERRDGIEAILKERLIRTLVRNTYDYHQQEIFLTIANEYTDWSRSTPTHHDILSEAAAALADGTVVAPMIETGVLHSQAVQITRSRASTHLLVFAPPSEPGCTSRTSPSTKASPTCSPVASDALPRDLLYLLGLPLRTTQSVLYPEFSRQEAKISQAFAHYLRNFLRDGDPNGPSHTGMAHHQGRGKDKQEPVAWPQFEPIHKMHLVLADGAARTGSHWDAHRLSIWNRLLPALHRPTRGLGAQAGSGVAQASLSPLQSQAQLQHQLLEDFDNPASFAGSIRNISFLLHPVTAIGQQHVSQPGKADSSRGGSLVSAVNNLDDTEISGRQDTSSKKNLQSQPGSSEQSGVTLESASSPFNALATLTSGPYSRPLLTVLVVGCSLLVVNLLVFVGTFCQHRERGAAAGDVKSSKQMGAKKIAGTLKTGGTDASPSEHTASAKASIKEEDVCLQKTILQKDAAMLFLQEATPNGSPAALVRVTTYQIHCDNTEATSISITWGSISGRSFTVMDGVRKLAAIEVNSSPPIGVGACHVPNVVPLGTIGQAPATPVGRTPQINPQGQQQATQGGLLAAIPPTTPQLPRSHQAATGNVLPQPDVAVTSSTAQSVTATMTLARHSMAHQFETHQQSSAKESGGRSSFKGGEETTV